MNTQIKYPKDKGRPIRVKKAKAEQGRWKKNPKNEKYPSDTFSVPINLLEKSMEDPACNGIQFCNGFDEKGNFSPVMCAVSEDGKFLCGFNTEKEILEEEFNLCRERWTEQFPVNNENIQFFYLGEEAIKMNIENFEVNKYTAAFVEKTDGTDSAVLYGYHLDGMKDPGDDEEPDTSLNDSYFCPPICLPPGGIDN